MRHWFTVFRYELRQQLGRKAFLFGAFGIPLLVVLGIMGFDALQGLGDDGDEATDSLEESLEDAAQIGYLDESGLFPAPAEDSPFAPFILRYERFADAESALQAGEISSLYVVGEDYANSGAITLWIDGFSFQALESNLMESYLRYSLGESLEPEVLARLQNPLATFQVNSVSSEGTQEEAQASTGISFVQVYVFALALMASTFSASTYLMSSVMQERQDQTIEIILTSVRPFALLLGKVLAMGLLGLITIAAWLGAIYFLISQGETALIDLSALEVKNSTLLIAGLYFLLGYGFMGGFYAAIGTLSNNMREGQTMAGWLVFPVLIPLFVIQMFVDNPNGPVPTLLSLIPFTAPLAMVMRSVMTDIPTAELLLSLALMLLLVLGMIWVASRLFRVRTLLRGNAPRLRELPRLLLQG